MPLWLWQEVQALPWSTEIVALTCVPRIACDPRRPYSSVHGKLVVQHRPKTKNVGTLPPLSSLIFFDHTGKFCEARTIFCEASYFCVFRPLEDRRHPQLSGRIA